MSRPTHGWVSHTVAALLGVGLLAQQPAELLTHGPLLGHVDTTSIHVWARAAEAGTYVLHLQSFVGEAAPTGTAKATIAGDCTLHFQIAGLSAGTAYDYWLMRGEQMVRSRGGATFVTAMPDDASEATIAFGSCANERAFPEQPIWGRILARAPHALVLLGDTPYIDLGTVDGRRQRHRAFFGFAAVRAALTSIPTWTTWDDHDFATNDQFGPVQGSETARGVFVDYHAHASYGDGTRGIYTSFRRGPIEVFVLDARSFADAEPSVLAPGERSLLGKAQTEWLQQGLRGSTATFRVLACGMVWNGGVRPNKLDCWGNWLPERDALLRWIGEQRIGGVVLVSGDVHRSRVILHPSQALAGYDVPEFVTSPLAQNVIESNAVPVPGLEFDAGEAHSCMFLSATRSSGGSALRAVFQAGDGREFHVREVGLAQLSRPDAAVSYRKIVLRMKVLFGEDLTRLPAAEHVDEGLPVSSEEAARADWRAAVADAQPLFAEWAVACREQRCRFSPTSEEPLFSEFHQHLLVGLVAFEKLALAQGLQALADRDAAGLAVTVRSLLGMARHLQQEAGATAWYVAGTAEQHVVELVRRTGEVLGDAAAGPLREEVRQHLGKRLPLAAAGAALRGEVYRMFDVSLRQLSLAADAKAQTARRFGKEVRRHFVELLEPCFVAFAALPDAPTAAQREEVKRVDDECRRRFTARVDAKKALGGRLTPDVQPDADLALMLAGLLYPGFVSLLDEQAATLAALRAAAK